MNISIEPAQLAGEIKAIPSKSQAHRMLICAAFADRATEISCPALSKDIEATAGCLAALGADISYAQGKYTVKPIESPANNVFLDCGESGSTLRFLLPVVCALGVEARIRMHGRLPHRPLSPLWEELERHGSILSRPGEDIIAVSGRLQAGEYSIAADVSSQFISGLLFALPLLKGESRLTLIGNLESGGYIELSLNALARFGVFPKREGRRFLISGKSRYVSPGSAEIEGDWSNAAFWIVADRISGKKIKVRGLDLASAQGDRAVIAAADKISSGGGEIDVSDIPDLVPILSVLAAVSGGETKFINAGRLRLKESDRLRAVADMLAALGGSAEEGEDSLSVRGGKSLRGGVVDSANDHRIAMSAAVAAIACKSRLTVLGAESVNKSYPAFWDDYIRLGGKLEREG